MSLRKKILPGVSLNLNKSGISTTVGSHGVAANKKLASLNTPGKEEQMSQGGFSIKALLLTIFGFGLCYTGDLPWWGNIIAAFFGVSGALWFIVDTVQNPKWLWLLPIISATSLYNGEFPWWMAAIHWIILIIGISALIYQIAPPVCPHCKKFIKNKDIPVCPHCQKIWESKPQ